MTATAQKLRIKRLIRSAEWLMGHKMKTNRPSLARNLSIASLERNIAELKAELRELQRGEDVQEGTD